MSGPAAASEPAVREASSTTATPAVVSSIPPTPTPPPHVTIQPITATTLPSYRRLITSLFPIRYQDKYYAETIADTTTSSLALCALWHDPSSSTSKSAFARSSDPAAGRGGGGGGGGGQLVGGIQCRLEPPPPSSSSSALLNKPNPSCSPTTTRTTKDHIPPHHHPPVSPPPPPAPTPAANSNSTTHQTHALYISTLAILSPYRHLGIASALLSHIIHTILTHPTYTPLRITSIYAHVWEANTDALEWYTRRGFTVEEGVVEGYYRRLKPMGARVVRRGIGVGDFLDRRR